jgi:DNA-binding transcriptional LysR family regulator
MIEISRLRSFRDLVYHGSFSATAAARSYTPSAISQQIALLERDVGLKLVERGSRGIRLTEAGKVLLPHAEAILDRLSDAEAELATLRDSRGAACV